MMNLRRTRRQIKDLGRLRQILQVLVKYGMGYFVDRLNQEHRLTGRKLPGLRSPRRPEQLAVPEPVRLRLMLEELGPTFIKFGQVLATRPDLIPLEHCAELEKLQDAVPACRRCDIEAEVERELGRPVSRMFDGFSETPMAAASLAQAHAARLKDGRPVAVKVQRPGVAQTVRADMDILMFLARQLERHVEESRTFNPVGIAGELRDSLARELDYTIEAGNIRRIREQFRDDRTAHIPQVFEQYSSRRVLTMELVDGIKVSDLEGLRRAGLDLKRIAANGARAYLKQIFVNGFFHADPHPGNIMVLPGNRIAFLDFGMVGRLHPDTRQLVVRILLGVSRHDPERIVDALRDYGLLDESAAAGGLQRLELDVEDFIDRHYVSALRELKVGPALAELLQLLARHKIRPSPELYLLARTLITVEGVGRQLDPGFDMAALVKPFAERLVRDSASPGRLARELVKFLESLYRFGRAVPRDLQEIIAKVKQGRLKIEFEHQGLEGLIRELDRVSNRLSFSLITAAIIVASSIIIHADKGLKVLGHPALGVLGYAVAGIMGLWLMWSIMRSGRL